GRTPFHRVCAVAQWAGHLGPAWVLATMSPDLETSWLASVWVTLALSLKVAGWATAIAVVLGVGMGFVLARVRLPGRHLLDTLLTLPMVLPPTVLGYYLLVLMGRRSTLGAWLYD